jgi:FkbM family methyltransferase
MNGYKIYYGTEDYSIDVTGICASRLMKNDIITIPAGDWNRSQLFTDPVKGVLKKVFVEEEDGVLISEYDDVNPIIIYNPEMINDLIRIHSKLQIKYGTFMEEIPEQMMVLKYVTRDKKVLEIGGNIGRNSLVIASLLENSKNLVVLESDPHIAMQLTENRDLNQFEFHIEASALSKRKIIQNGLSTLPSDVLLPDYKWVNTITWKDLHAKYNIEFDTLVLDCEGAFYYILMDIPEILDNMNIIIVENDYTDKSHKEFVDEILVKNNFKRVYIKSLHARVDVLFPENFYEVWKRE